jgi:hypothetical protein
VAVLPILLVKRKSAGLKSSLSAIYRADLKGRPVPPVPAGAVYADRPRGFGGVSREALRTPAISVLSSIAFLRVEAAAVH